MRQRKLEREKKIHRKLLRAQKTNRENLKKTETRQGELEIAKGRYMGNYSSKNK